MATTAQPVRTQLSAGERPAAGVPSEAAGTSAEFLPSVGPSLLPRRQNEARVTGQSASLGRHAPRSARHRVAAPLITLQQQVLPKGAIQMSMPVYAVVDTSALRSTSHCPAAALRRSKPAFIDLQAGDDVETLMQTVLQALAKANRLGPDFLAKFDSHSVQLVPAAATHKIALDRGGSRRLWQYFATEIMEGIEVRLQLKLTPPPPPHARGYKAQTAEEKAAGAKAAARTARERARRVAKTPHPPEGPRTVPAPMRVDRVDTVAARVVNRVQAVIEARQHSDAELAAHEQEIEQAMAALDRVNEKRVALEQKKLSRFASFNPSNGRPRVQKSGRDLAAHMKKSSVTNGSIPMQKSQMDKAQNNSQKLHTAQAVNVPAAFEGKEDDIRPPVVHKRLGFAGLPKALRPKKHKSRVQVESRKNKDLSKEGAKVLTAEERLQRESDQIAYVLNNMISGKRKLYGTMMRDAKSAFAAIDKDGSGSLDYAEFSAFLKRLGLGLKEEQTTELANLMDADGSGEIDCDEFVAALHAAEKRAKEEDESTRRKLDQENDTLRRAIYTHENNAREQEEGQTVSELQHMRARILRTKRNREIYSHQLTGPQSLTRAAGFPAPTVSVEADASTGTEAHGVTVAIRSSQPDPDSGPDLGEFEPDVEGVDEKIVSTDESFTSAEYLEVIDEMEVAEVIDACRHWGIEQDDISSMREKLRKHYVTMYGTTDSEDEEVPEDSSASRVDNEIESDTRTSSALHLDSAAEVSDEEVTATSRDAVVAAVAKVYADMDIEKQEVAVAAALRAQASDDDLGEDHQCFIDDGGYGDEDGADIEQAASIEDAERGTSDVNIAGSDDGGQIRPERVESIEDADATT